MKTICKSLLLLILFFQHLNSYSQITPQIEWQKTIGGSGIDNIVGIVQTTDGGFLLGGTSSSNISGDKTENSNGDLDYWIVKTDSSGNIQWQNSIGGSGSDQLQALMQTDDGGFILAGYSASIISGDKTETGNGFNDYWVLKIDSIGNIQWQNSIGGDNYDFLQSIDKTSDGGYILGGFSESGISGDKTEMRYGAQDYWIVKIDSVGTVQWENTIGGNDLDRMESLQQTSDGGFILAGNSTSDSSVDKTENRMGGGDCWIVKTDSLGNIQWQNTIGGNSVENALYIRQTNDGGYIVGAYSESNISGDKTEDAIGGSDIWLIKIDAVGNIQWQNTIGGNNSDFIYTVSESTDNGYTIIGGSRSNISGDKTEESNDIGCDFWIIKTDSIGNIQWQNTIGGDQYDIATSIHQFSDGKYMVAGNSRSGISIDKTENSRGSDDYWMLKLTDKYSSFSGKMYMDFNGNNIQEPLEPSIQNKIVTCSNGQVVFSMQHGYYDIALYDTGTFTAAPQLINYYNCNPAYHTASFSGFPLTDSLNDFAFQTVNVIDDLCITITPSTFFRPGIHAGYTINYENVGTTIQSPTVVFYPDNVTYVSSIPPATTITTDSIVWDFPPLAPFQSGSIQVAVAVSPGAVVGSNINSGVKIFPIAGDANPSCNVANREVLVTASLDPNDILVDEDTLSPIQLSNLTYLDYIIRFQNTGNDTAFNVKILNPIDTSVFELNTIEFISSSHPVNLQWNDWERNMQFSFENILLPDSNTDEIASHGFVRYKIQPKPTLATGDTILNYAAIYFDYNSPVITNQARTDIDFRTSTFNLQTSSLDLQLFPNPAGNKINISSPLLKDKAFVRVFDLIGTEKISLWDSFKTQLYSLDIGKLNSGIYIIEVEHEKSIVRKRFVKQ